MDSRCGGPALAGLEGVAIDPAANLTVMAPPTAAAGPQACNSLASPDFVVPATLALPGGAGASFGLELLPWSLTFVRVRLVRAAAAARASDPEVGVGLAGLNLGPTRFDF